MKRVFLTILCLLSLQQHTAHAQCAGIEFDCPNFGLIVDLAVDTAGNLNLCEGEPITFLNQTSDNLGVIDSFVWIWNYLGNPTTSQDCDIAQTTADVTHIYSFEDSIICARPNQDFIILSVGLSAIDTNGCFSLVQSNEIVVNIRPRALFSVTTRVCEGEPVQFLNQSCPITDNISFFWESQPDGQTSTNFTPGFTYDEPGTYTVTLTNTTPICNFEDSYTREITVLPYPEPGLVIANPENGDSLCAGIDTLVVINQSTDADSVLWTVTPATDVEFLEESQGRDTVLIRFNQTGAYTITMTVFNQQCASDTSFIFYVEESDYLALGDVPSCVDSSALDLGALIDTSFGIPDAFEIVLTEESSGAAQVFSNQLPGWVVLQEAGNYILSVWSESPCGNYSETASFYYFEAPVLQSVPTLCGDQDTVVNLNSLLLSAPDYCTFWEGPGVYSDSLFNPSLTGAGIYEVAIRDCDTLCAGQSLELVVIGPNVPLENLLVCAADLPLSLDELLEGQWSGPAVTADSLYPASVSPGTYPLYYTTNPGDICDVRDTIFVEIQADVAADFSVNSPTCTDSTFAFVNLSGAPVLQWYFGDGNQSAAAQPLYSYSEPGTYLVSLVVGTEGGCTDSIAREVVAEALPDPAIRATVDSVGCDSIRIFLIAVPAIPGTDYQWLLSDGQVLQGDSVRAFIPTLDSAQVLNIQLQATNSCGPAAATVELEAPAGFSAGITYDSEVVRCPGEPVDFIDLSNGLDSFIVDYGNGLVSYNEVLDISFANTADSVVEYTVVLYGFNEICGWDTGVVIVPVRPAEVVASALYDDGSACQGDAIQFIDNSAFQDQSLLYFGDGGTALLGPGDTVYYSYPRPGLFTPSVVAFGCGSDSNALDPILIYALPAIDIEVVPGNPCTGDDVVLFNGGNTVAPVWTLNGDTIGLFTDTLYFTDVAAGTYTVVLQAYSPDGAFCLSADSVTFTVGEPPVFSALADPVAGCAPLAVQVSLMSNQPGVTFFTDFSNQQVAQGSNPSTVYNQPGNYQLLATAAAAGGCISDTIIPIAVSDAYIVALSGDSVIQIGEPVLLDFTVNQAYESFTWFAMDTVLGQNTSRPLMLFPEEHTLFAVEVTGPDVNCEGRDELWVQVICDELFLPDAFSPNGDGSNDRYSIYKVFTGYEENVRESCVELIRWSVFDRWGERVFDSESFDDAWDGTFRGKLLNTGLFTLVVQHRDRQGEVHLERREIHLFR